MAIKHPYQPSSISLPHYVENTLSSTELVSIFFIATAFISVATLYFISRFKQKFNFCEKLILLWFSVCGFIHCFLEGFFGLNHKSLHQSHHFLAQVWKEYGKADSRYIISDPCIVSIESLTAFLIGPMCFLTVWSFVRNYPQRYVFQLVVSVAQLYGTIIYFWAEILDGFKHGVMWHPVYFWFYVVFFNGFWIMVPLMLMHQSLSELTRVQLIADKFKAKQS